METKELVRQALEEPSAFEELVRQYSGLVYSVCYGFTGNRADSEDLTQEVWLSVYDKLRSLRDAEKFTGWLRRVAANLCKMWLRRSEPPAEREDRAAGEAEPSPDRQGTEARLLANEALGQVPKSNRLPLLLRHLGGYSHREIAAMLGITEQKVKSRLHEGKRQLKAGLVAVVEQILAERFDSAEMARKVVSRCQERVCRCTSELIDG